MNTAKRSMTLTTILALAFFSLSVSVLLISGIVEILAYNQTQAESIATKQRLIAGDVSAQVINFIQMKISTMKANATASSIIGDQKAKQTELIASLNGSQPDFHHVALLDESGRFVTGNSRYSITKLDEFASGLPENIGVKLSADDVFISAVKIDSSTSEPIITIIVADKSGLGDIKNILAAEVTLKFLWQLMETLQVGKTGYAYVTDRTGAIIAFKDSSYVLKGEKADKAATVADFIANKFFDKSTVIKKYRGIMGRDVVGTYVPLETPDWAIVVEIPIDEAYAEVTTNTFITILIIFIMAVIAGGLGILIAKRLSVPLVKLTATATRISEGDTGLQAEIEGSMEIATLANAFNSMTSQLRNRMEGFRKMNETLGEIVTDSKSIVVNLNSSAKEIEAAAQEQTSASNEHASGITEVSATLQELTITAKQITGNVGELVYSSEETMKLLKASEKQLLETVSQLDDVGAISKNNTAQIGELGKRSVIINEMVELIKEVANKTNILSINASIEASRSGEAGAGFSVVAAEIRELSKETIESAKKADIAAKEIKEFLNSIIISSENESVKVLGSGKTVRGVFENVGSVVSKISNNYGFTQKIDVSIKQQENGSIQAAQTMKQMAEIARQSAETARQILIAVKDIVSFSAGLEKTVTKYNPEG